MSGQRVQLALTLHPGYVGGKKNPKPKKRPAPHALTLRKRWAVACRKKKVQPDDEGTLFGPDGMPLQARGQAQGRYGHDFFYPASSLVCKILHDSYSCGVNDKARCKQ